MRLARLMFGPLAALLALALSGCANFAADGGMATVQAAAAAELGKDVVKIRNEREAAVASARVKSLIKRPLTVGAAIEIALLNNRGLQAAYNELGISEAEMVEASLPPPPTVALSRLLGSGGYEIERQLVQNVLALLSLPRRREIAEVKFRQAQLRAVEATLRTAAEARRAYYRAVAARQTAKFLEDMRLSAEALSDVAKGLGETGAMSKLEQAREHVFYAEVSGQLAAARLRERLDRERLIRALGLWGGDANVRLPDALPTLPARPMSIAAVEREAVRRRVDLIIAHMEVERLAKELGLTEATRFINVLEVTGASTAEKETKREGADVEVDKTKRRGFEVEFQIPIYDFGEARTRLAEETYMRSVNRLLELAVAVRGEAREAYQSYRGAYDIARHYDREILPLRQIISEETLLNYNAMISDLFALLADSRARIAANVQAIEARRDFWLASVDLHTAIVGGRGGTEVAEAALARVNAGADGQGH
ncbi:MAG TPA: TolC family protein [Hyphomicrobiaceae bacterium]|nr:TolC family protein [Hyphomicrobiaceae bacterium]